MELPLGLLFRTTPHHSASQPRAGLRTHERGDRAEGPRADSCDGWTGVRELFLTKRGTLLMLWASYMKYELGRNGYVQTLARSKSGELKGPWEQLQPLV